MNNFFEYSQDKAYKYKILVYPNITYMKDLEKDSYVVVLRNVINELNKVRDDIHWTILSPKYSHLPEQTLALKNLFHNSTNISPKIIGYSHWFEVKENSNYESTMLAQNLLGVLEMDECGVNSIWLKDFVIKKSKELFSDKQVKQLEEKINKP